jgi:hypothetical protein
MQSKESKRLIPTGECWCGCGEETQVGSFFVAGHDKRAEAAVVKTVYGSVPALLIAHGFGPDGKSADEELRRYQDQGGDYL